MNRPSELQIMAAALRALTFRPLPFPKREHVHATTQTSVYGSLVLGLALVTIFELAAVHFLISAFIETHQWAWHIGVVVIHLYGMAWLLGDFRLMRETGHELDDGVLRIRLGARWNAEIPLETIESIEVGEVAELDRLAGEKLPDGTVSVTPWDTPNLTLTLSQPATLRTYFGLTKTASVLQLRVDEPRRLGDALASR